MSDIDAADDGNIAWDWIAERFMTTPDGLTGEQRRAVTTTMRTTVAYALWRTGTCRQDGSPMLTEDRP